MTTINYFNQEQQVNFCNIVIANVAKECVRCASEHNGCVFGGYVRDVVLPIYLNKSDVKVKIQDLKFKDIDFWFENDEDATAFITAMGPMLRSNPRHDTSNSSFEYPFVRKQFHVISDETVLFWIDVIISEELPVNDFEINKACFIVRDGKFVQKNEDFLFSGRFNKEIVMYEDYIKILLSPKNVDRHGCNPYFNRVINRFLLQGYKIYIDNDFSPYFCMIDGEDVDGLKRRFQSYLLNVVDTRARIEDRPAAVKPVIKSQSLDLVFVDQTQAKLQSLEKKIETLTNTVEKIMYALNIK